MPYRGPERRKYFRLKYPVLLRPTLVLDAGHYPITEISESGLRFKHEDHEHRSGTVYTVSVVFPEGEEGTVVQEIEEAMVIRRLSEETALFFSNGISFDQMVKEQMRVIRHTFAKQDIEELESLSRRAFDEHTRRRRRKSPKRRTLTRYPALRWRGESSSGAEDAE